MQVIAVTPQGFELQAANEIHNLGAKEVKPFPRGVSFQADKACLYRLHLQARLPFRFLREIDKFECYCSEDLYSAIQSRFNWKSWLPPDKSFRVNVTGQSNYLPHGHYTALQVKNALVDFQREVWGIRSEINLLNPDICIHLHLNNDLITLSLDGTAQSLHKRGYRAAVGDAPLKENLAAGLINFTGWDGSKPLFDPMCGSGTFLIEAVNSALGISPGLKRNFLFRNWIDFEPSIWNKEVELANRLVNRSQTLPPIIGCERDNYIAQQAQDNLLKADLEKYIHINSQHFSETILPNQPGIIVCNPPYGKRLGNSDNLESLYSELGHHLKNHASGWEFWLLSGNKSLTKFLGMKCLKRIPISNGGIDCRWLKYMIY